MKICSFFLLTAIFFAAHEKAAAQEDISDILEDTQEETTAQSPPSVNASEESATQETVSKQAPIMEIKRLETDKPLYALELRDVEIGDLFRVLAHDYNLNLLVDKEVGGTVTASLSNVSLEEALDTIAESQNLSLKKKGTIIRISLNLVTKIFSLKYIEAKGIAEPLSSSQESSSSEGEGTAQQAGTIYDLLSEKGKVFLGKQPNSIVVIDYPPYLERIEAYIREIDKKMASRVFKLKYLKAAEVVGLSANITSSSTESPSSSAQESASSSEGSY